MRDLQPGQVRAEITNHGMFTTTAADLEWAICKLGSSTLQEKRDRIKAVWETESDLKDIVSHIELCFYFCEVTGRGL